jgi:ribosomal protein S12 methylthiotransferase
LITTAKHYAYLKISEGCDRPCSFCAIPIMRGKHVSKPIEQIVEEARNLAKNGVKELLLIAQDSTYYGLDIYKKRNLAELLDRLSDLEGIEWIRLHYAFPSGFPDDILDVIARKPSLCNYLDIPLQHASTHMLEIMRRGTRRDKTERLLERIREKVPGIAIRTTMLVGHPGETSEDFRELMEFTEKWKFERLGVFTYSHEEGTHAYGMKDNISQKVKESRANELMNLQEQISLEHNEKKNWENF